MISQPGRCTSQSQPGRGPVRFRAAWALLLGLLLPAARPAAAQGYTVTDLGTLGGSTSTAYALNAVGQVVGTAALPGDTASHAFLWDNGVMRDLGTLGGSASTAYGINRAGQVVGTAKIPGDLDQHAFLYSGGVMHDLGTLWVTTSSIARGINDAGQIVGYTYQPGSVYDFAFLCDSRGIHDMPDSWRSGSAYAFAINASGQVVGSMGGAVRYDPSGPVSLGWVPMGGSEALAINAGGRSVGYSQISGPRAVLFDEWGLHNLGTLPGSYYSQANGINGAGQVVGYCSSDLPGTLRAFLYSSGVMTDLNTLLAPGSGWTLTQAQAINDHGQIVGVGDHAGQSRAFLLTPPAPPAPSGLTATVVSGTQVFLSWTDNSGDETAYALWRQTGSGPFVRIGVFTPNTTSALDASATSGTAYTYEIRAIGLGGASDWSNPITVTPAPPALAPPTFLSAAMRPRAQIGLTWTDNSTNETAFAIWRKIGGGAYTRIGVVPPNSTGFTDIGVSPSTLYTYEVRATNDTVASAWTNEVSLTTPAQPDPPDQMRAAASGRQVTVSWSWTYSSHVATAAELFRTRLGNARVRIAVLPPDTTSYVDTGLDPNTRYDYQVRTANDYFASYWSTTAVGITGP